METPPREDSSLKSKVLVIVVALVVAIAGQVFDRVLLHEGIPRYDLLAVSNLLTGTVAGAFFWQAMRRDRDRRKFIRERLHTISEMNHHIRNALQVISLHSYREHDEKSVAQLQQAVNRVEWALNEILPGELPADLVPDLSRGHSQSETANP
jgi:hypothetical protein